MPMPPLLTAAQQPGPLRRRARLATPLGLLGLLAACATPAPPAIPPREAPQAASPVAVRPPEPTPAAEPPPSIFPRTVVMEDYIRRVKVKIRQYMRFPVKKSPPAPNYETLFQIGLKPDMRIESVQIVRGSGNPRYDAAAKLAIEKAGSYPPLPEGLDFNLFASHKIRYKLHDTP